jgi:peptidoglycan/xylan/chitin deacetylase (PgdA/CDA1 family)
VLEATNDGEPITLFRPPYAARDSRTDAVVAQMRLLQVLWSVDSQDSAGAGPDTIASRLESGMHPGAIILMHETYDRSVAALPRVLAIAHRRGLQLVTVPQLLALDPPSDGMVGQAGGGCQRG